MSSSEQRKKKEATGDEYSSLEPAVETARPARKRVVAVGAGLLVLIAVVLVVIFSQKSDDVVPIPPTPDVPSGLDFAEFNPYQLIGQDYGQQDWYVNGVLNNTASQALNVAEQAKSLSQTYNRLQSAEGLKAGQSYRPVDPSKIPTGQNNRIPEQIAFNFSLISNYHARVQIGALGQSNFSVPNETFARPVQEFEARFTQLGLEMAKEKETFGWSLKNIFNGEQIISTKNRKFVIQEKYSEIGFVLPNDRLFGLGISNKQFRLQMDSTYTLWSQGRINDTMPADDGLGGRQGSQTLPFILGQTDNKEDWYGIFFVGGGAQTFELVAVEGTSKVILNYIVLDNQMEFYVMMRGSAKSIIQRYQKQIGFPSLPSYFNLGIFTGSQSKNWDSSQKIQASVQAYLDKKLPIEGVLVDGYTKDRVSPFTVDETVFGNLTALAEMLKANNMRTILAIESTLPVDETYYPLAKANGSLMSACADTSKPELYFTPFGGSQKTQICVVDYFSAEATVFTKSALDQLASLMGDAWDGLYLRGNSYLVENDTPVSDKLSKARSQLLSDPTPPNPEDVGNYTSYKLGPADQTAEDFNRKIPFSPGYANSGYLNGKTLPLDYSHRGMEHYENPHAAGVREFYWHNLNGLQQHRLFHEYLRKNQTQRTNVYSESAWPGTGFIGGSWTQPVERSWQGLRRTISMAMSAGINGINNWVTEVCGVEGSDPSDAELCTRWMELAAFLPMVRIQGPIVDELALNDSNFNSAMKQRLQFTRYIYSQMYSANFTGGSLVYPLFFDHPSDDKTLDYIEDSFMLGDSIYVCPVLDAYSPDGQFQGYFPKGVWRDLNDYSKSYVSDGSKTISLDRLNGTTQAFLREGKILPVQNRGNTPERHETTKNYETEYKISLVISRDDSNYADGFVLVDDGISHGNFANEEYTFWKVRMAEKAINFWVERGNYLFDVYAKDKQIIDQLEEVKILGAQDLNNTDYACYMGTELNPKKMNYTYDAATETLTLTPIETNLTFKDIGFIKFGNSSLEPNVCDSTGFTYHARNLTANATTTYNAFQLTPASATSVLEPLVLTVQLMDDEGSLNVNITTQSDWDSGMTKFFRAPHVQDWSKNYPLDKITKKVTDFVAYESGAGVPFGYMLTGEGNPSQILYRQNATKLYLTEFLVFDDGIFNMNTLNDNPLIGMGERAGDLFFKNETGGIHSRWTHDAANPIDDGLPPGRNMYGFQPFYMYQSDSLEWIGVFNNNPYATDYIVYTNNGINSEITTVMIGGMIEKYFFRGSKPDDVIIKYEKLTGMPTMPPLWSFGWQQCRFGWVTDEIWEFIVDSYEQFELPIDTMWADIDYMDDYKIFTISQSRYSRLPKLVEGIRAKNMTFVPIMDAGVAVRFNEDYEALTKGLNEKIFIKQAQGEEPLTAGVWCGDAYFPDYYNPATTNYWHDMFDYLKNTYGLEFDGIWLDMNEATNFCDGYCKPEERPKDSLRNKAYYVPGQRDLEVAALGVDGMHHNGFHEYDVHNTFSLMQVKATAEYLIKQNLRPYVLSRSNFQGIQKYGYHWLGDNWSWVEYMIASVKNIYEYQIFGLPFMGCDLCGFNGDAPGDLCTRWHQVGTLFPFARNHNQNATTPQEPFRFNQTFRAGSDVTYTDLIRTAIQNRYTFIRYYYSQFWNINEFGGSFFKPLFFEFPNDPDSYVDIERNMLLGNSLKASVEVTRLSDGSTKFYFPAGIWCQLLPYVKSDYFEGCITSDGDITKYNITMQTNMEDYYVHQRNGSIVPTQNATSQKTMNTPQQLSQYTDLSIVPDAQNTLMSSSYVSPANSSAMGYLYFDDGVSHTKNISRIDVAYSFNSSDYSTIADVAFLNPVKGFRSTVVGARNEELGTLTIFNPFVDPIASSRMFQSVTLYTTADPSTGIDISNMTTYAGGIVQGKILQVAPYYILQNDEQLHYRFDEISRIQIVYGPL